MSKKPAAAAAPTGAPTGPLRTPEQEAERVLLIEEAKALLAAVTHERGLSASMRQERDALNALWATGKQELEAKRGELRKLESALSEQAAEAALEVRLHKARIKELLTGQAGEVAGAQTSALTSLQLQQEAGAESERELKADKRELAVALKELEASHEELVRVAKLDNDRAVTALRLNWERRAGELQALFEDRMARTREDMNRSREEAVKGVERTKAAHVAALLASHERAFADIKAYFGEITHSNLDLIKSLKEELDDMRKKEAGDERVMFAIAAENKRMSEPMRKAIEDVRRLAEEREAYRRDIAALQETKAAALVVTDRLEALRWEHEILEQRFLRLKAERDALHERFQAAVHEVAQKGGFKAQLLELKLAAAAEEVEKQDALLGEVLAAANIGGGAGGAADLRGKLAAVVAEKDAAIAAAQAEVAALAAKHDATLEAFAAALKERGISLASLGFKPASAAEVLGVKGAA